MVRVWFTLNFHAIIFKSHNVAIVRKLEQSTSSPVDHHCKSLNNAKQSLTRLVCYESNDLTWLFPGNCFLHCLHQSAEQMNIIEEWTDRHLSALNSSSLGSRCGLQNTLKVNLYTTPALLVKVLAEILSTFWSTGFLNDPPLPFLFSIIMSFLHWCSCIFGALHAEHCRQLKIILSH